MKIAFYGGSFDPVHIGHMAVARALMEEFELDRFVFLPAFHAPHKIRLIPTSAICRYTMLCFATEDDANISVSRIEIEQPEQPYTVETLPKLKELFPEDELYFVMGADSWEEITTWREWEKVLSMVNHIVVTRPGHSVASDHVTEAIREKIGKSIFFTDAVEIDVSATDIRAKIRNGDASWQAEVPDAAAKYIIKYQLYR